MPTTRECECGTATRKAGADNKHVLVAGFLAIWAGDILRLRSLRLPVSLFMFTSRLE